MNKKEKIEQEIAKTLEQFEAAEPLSPNPYFYSRLQAKIDQKKKAGFSFFPLLKPALLAALLVLNVTTILWYVNSPGEETPLPQELKSVLADDFGLGNSSESLTFLNGQ